MKREVYKETPNKEMDTLNPFVEMPRMRLDEINRINELIERDKAMAVIKKDWEVAGNKYTDYKCPICNTNTRGYDNFCGKCGQRVDRDNIEF